MRNAIYTQNRASVSSIVFIVLSSQLYWVSPYDHLPMLTADLHHRTALPLSTLSV